MTKLKYNFSWLTKVAAPVQVFVSVSIHKIKKTIVFLLREAKNLRKKAKVVFKAFLISIKGFLVRLLPKQSFRSASTLVISFRQNPESTQDFVVSNTNFARAPSF